MAAEQCRNCQAELRPADRYCANCGQSVAEAEDRSIRHLLQSSFAEVSSVDSRLWRSLRFLFLRPGYLSREHRERRRHRYLSPIGLFLLANLLFFLAPPLSDFQLSLAEQYELQPYSPWIAPLVDNYLEESGQEFAAVAERYQLRVVELAKLMVILHVPLLALGTLLLTPDRRYYYADHVVMALHYLAFLMIYLITVALLFGLVVTLLPGGWPKAWPSPVQPIILLQFLYVPFMLKQALELPWWRAIVSAVLFVLILLAAHLAYRLVQFLVTFGAVTAG